MSDDPDEPEEQDEFNEDLMEEPVKSKKPMGKPAPAIKSKKPMGKPSKGSGDQITVYFQSTIGPGEKKQKMLVDVANPVGDIKQTVGAMYGLEPDDFHLSFGGVTMDESSPLSEYGVSDGDTLLLIPASTAG
ncbi:MAG TPA: ubiquitin-like domain-containing protein [Candidatus Lokiarchaeia archaeon]|nr:ubiquitin-like domain-containing protein [Candidatus Lokiarchaeia archaeon]